MQPIVTVDGIRRFKENKLVSWLVEQSGGVNNLVVISRLRGVGTVEDYDQVMMLLGVSTQADVLSESTRELVRDIESNPEVEKDPQVYRIGYRAGYARAKNEAVDAVKGIGL